MYLWHQSRVINQLWRINGQKHKYFGSTQLDSASNRHNHPKYRYSTWPRVEYQTTIQPTIRPRNIEYFLNSEGGRVIRRSLAFILYNLQYAFKLWFLALVFVTWKIKILNCRALCEWHLSERDKSRKIFLTVTLLVLLCVY